MPVAAIALIIIGGFFAVMNWACLVSSLVTKKNHSMVPPLGGLLLAVGFALHPALRPYAICGLLLDIGFWALLFAIPMMLVEALRSAPWRRVARISGQWSEITFHLSLYRPDYYVVKVSRALPSGETGWIERGSFGRWSTAGSGLQLISHTDTDESPSRLTLSSGLGSAEFPVAESTNSLADNAPEFPPAGVVLHAQ
ncbi:hypothetical protein [Haloferula rosea]|uniref:hypothetical protein n=1 Tax=Haloferula rosea TaxID=490093 RepID=UPI001F29A96B|nr:hypothetical protein [Haloferula rosea]